MTAKASGLKAQLLESCRITASSDSTRTPSPAGSCSLPTPASACLTVALVRIARGYERTANGRVRRLTNDDMLLIAREACDGIGLNYDYPNGPAGKVRFKVPA